MREPVMGKSASDDLALEPMFLAHALICTSWRYPVEDLVQVMRIGFWQAEQDWRREKGAAFRTYCMGRARGHVAHYIRDEGYLIGLPAYLQEMGVKRGDPIWIDGMEEQDSLELLGRGDFVNALLERLEPTPKPVKPPKPLKLTKGEIEVLDYYAQGLTAQETADVLVRSTRTVQFHLQNIHDKLGVSSTLKALWMAVQLGLMPCPCRKLVTRT